MLTELSFVDLIGVSLPAGHIRVRTATRVLRDGAPFGSDQYHSVSLAPGDPLPSGDADLAAIAAATWTPERVSAYRAEQDARAAAEAEAASLALANAEQSAKDAIAALGA